MGASLSILLTVLAQAAAPAAPPCNPPCAAGQYCASDGRCYVPAPAPNPPPGNDQQPPPGTYQEQPPPGYYQQPPPQQPPSGYYQQPPQQPPGYQQPPQQGYYQQPQNPPPGAYPQNAPPPGYAQQPGYQQPPGYPPPGVYQPGVRPSRYKEGPRFGLFLGGIVVPGSNVSAAAGGAILTFGSPEFGFETRIYGAFFTVDDEDTKTEGTAVFWHSTRWWGVYGFGFGSGLGYADFTDKSGYGWNDSSGQLLAYIAPVMLRFGRQPTFELGLNSGATLFFSHDVRPYGYAYGGILF